MGPLKGPRIPETVAAPRLGSWVLPTKASRPPSTQTASSVRKCIDLQYLCIGRPRCLVAVSVRPRLQASSDRGRTVCSGAKSCWRDCSRFRKRCLTLRCLTTDLLRPATLPACFRLLPPTVFRSMRWSVHSIPVNHSRKPMRMYWNCNTTLLLRWHPRRPPTTFDRSIPHTAPKNQRD